MLSQVPRVAGAIASGLIRAGSATPGLGIRVPHVYAARCSLLLDTDVYAHMNNASYLVHCELARWQMGAETGALRTMASEGLAFVVGSVAIRYRRPIRPLARFEVHTQLVDWDDARVMISHTFRKPEGGAVLAQALCRAVCIGRGGERVSGTAAVAAIEPDAAVAGPPTSHASLTAALAAMDSTFRSHGDAAAR